VAKQFALHTQQVLFQYPELRKAEGERHVVAEVTQIAKMMWMRSSSSITPRKLCARAEGVVRDALHRLRIGPRVGHGAVAADASGKLCTCSRFMLSKRFRYPCVCSPGALPDAARGRDNGEAEVAGSMVPACTGPPEFMHTVAAYCCKFITI